MVERYGVEVVPITITIDDEEYLEGVDLDADAFYDRFEGRGTADDRRPASRARASSRSPTRSCSIEDARRSCRSTWASAVSGTLNSARLAAHRLGVPVRLVDSATAGFGIGCCVWAAGDAIARGAAIDEAAAVAESVAPGLGNVFIVGSLDVLRAGGRFDVGDPACPIPVLALRDGAVMVVAEVDTVLDAVNTMATAVVGLRQPAAGRGRPRRPGDRGRSPTRWNRPWARRRWSTR